MGDVLLERYAIDTPTLQTIVECIDSVDKINDTVVIPRDMITDKRH